MPQGLSDWGSWASIVSLAVTFGVLWNVRQLRRTYIYKGRGRELIDKLKQHRTNLSTFLTDFESSAGEFRRELSVIESTLHSLEEKFLYLSRLGRHLRKVRKMATWHLAGRTEAEAFYGRVLYLSEALEQDWRDREWHS